MREKRLIDADALIPAITDYYEPIDPSQPMTFNLAQIKEAVDTMPSVEPKRGEWIFQPVFGEDPYACSVCGNTVNIHGYGYCPNCGADMREVKK